LPFCAIDVDLALRSRGAGAGPSRNTPSLRLKAV